MSNESKSKNLGGISIKVQIFLLVTVFLLLIAIVSSFSTYDFILRDKESSLRELQLLKSEQITQKIDTKLNSIKAIIQDSAIRLLDRTRTRPDLDETQWQWVVAGKNKWQSTQASPELVPSEARGASTLKLVLSDGGEHIDWFHEVEIVDGNKRKKIPVQARFSANLIFSALADFSDGAMEFGIYSMNSGAAPSRVWGAGTSEQFLSQAGLGSGLSFESLSSLASRQLVVDSNEYYFAYAKSNQVPWVAVSMVPQSVLLRGLRYLFANQGFWTLVILFLAVVTSIWLARRFSKPVETIVDASLELETGNFGVRVEPSGPSEVRNLGATFNHMGAALEEREVALRAAQDALIQNEKLAALGTLSAGIAHEVKNPLAGILGNADLLTGILAKDSTMENALSYAETIRKETKRCREIIDSLMRFSRQESAEIDQTDVDLEIIVWDSINLVEHSLNMQGIQIEKLMPPDMLMVRGVGNQIEQVLLNLMQNAGHAMEDSESKTLEVGVKTFSDASKLDVGSFIAHQPDSLSGPVARVWIKDTGSGMEQEVLKRIFEPFFTTKEAGKGTGLGLAVTMGIIADHHARLSIDSAPGQGTTFYIDFPTVGPRSEEVVQKLDKLKERAQGGEVGKFDVSTSSANQSSDLGTLNQEVDVDSLGGDSLFEGDAEPTNVEPIGEAPQVRPPPPPTKSAKIQSIVSQKHDLSDEVVSEPANEEELDLSSASLFEEDDSGSSISGENEPQKPTFDPADSGSAGELSEDTFTDKTNPNFKRPDHPNVTTARFKIRKPKTKK